VDLQPAVGPGTHRIKHPLDIARHVCSPRHMMAFDSRNGVMTCIVDDMAIICLAYNSRARHVIGCLSTQETRVHKMHVQAVAGNTCLSQGTSL